jgi:hypothetical protein
MTPAAESVVAMVRNSFRVCMIGLPDVSLNAPGLFTNSFDALGPYRRTRRSRHRQSSKTERHWAQMFESNASRRSVFSLAFKQSDKAVPARPIRIVERRARIMFAAHKVVVVTAIWKRRRPFSRPAELCDVEFFGQDGSASPTAPGHWNGSREPHARRMDRLSGQ